MKTIAALTPTAAATQAPTPAAPVRAEAAPATVPLAHVDQLQPPTLRSSAPASIPLLPSAPKGDGVDFTKLFQGFKVGGKLKVSTSVLLAGGSGTLQGLSATYFKFSGKVSILGMGEQPLDVELRKQADGTYRMSGTSNIHVAIVQKGNQLTITDLDSPTHKVFLTNTKSGTIEVKTVGMGFDAISGKVRAK
jgi:hypothetical protein